MIYKASGRWQVAVALADHLLYRRNWYLNSLDAIRWSANQMLRVSSSHAIHQQTTSFSWISSNPTSFCNRPTNRFKPSSCINNSTRSNQSTTSWWAESMKASNYSGVLNSLAILTLISIAVQAASFSIMQSSPNSKWSTRRRLSFWQLRISFCSSSFLQLIPMSAVTVRLKCHRNINLHTLCNVSRLSSVSLFLWSWQIEYLQKGVVALLPDVVAQISQT